MTDTQTSREQQAERRGPGKADESTSEALPHKESRLWERFLLVLGLTLAVIGLVGHAREVIDPEQCYSPPRFDITLEAAEDALADTETRVRELAEEHYDAAQASDLTRPAKWQIGRALCHHEAARADAERAGVRYALLKSSDELVDELREWLR